MGKIALPPLPLPGLNRLRWVLRRIPPQVRGDAVQDAWIAYMTGGSPVGAAVTCWKRAKRLAGCERLVDAVLMPALTPDVTG
jgi:hypothetical protein